MCITSFLEDLDPPATTVEAVEELVERELAAHNKPNIQVSMTFCLCTQ